MLYQAELHSADAARDITIEATPGKHPADGRTPVGRPHHRVENFALVDPPPDRRRAINKIWACVDIDAILREIFVAVAGAAEGQPEASEPNR